MNRLAGVQNLKSLNSVFTGLKKIPDAVSGLNQVSSNLDRFSEQLGQLSAAMAPLESLKGLKNINSIFNGLKSIPDVMKGLDQVDMARFAEQLERVRVAIVPLASEMEKVSKGFSSLPANIQKAIAANQKLTASATKTSKSYGVLGTGISSFYTKLAAQTYVIRRIAYALGDSLTDFNAYVENVNLFSVSMGSFTDKAADFAESLQNILGVDSSEAMRNMGVIQNLVTSFGVASEQAYILSKNITQLGYDFASFFNISTDDAFTKLQAAISGELEPIRRLGVDISEARLQQELFALGIDATVKNLNQADKSLLRYIAIMKQTGNAQTDMARTLDSPANRIRVFQAQIGLLSRSIGSLLIPILNAVLPPLIAFVQVLREGITWVAGMLGVTVEFASATSSAGNAMSGVSAGLDDVGSGAADAAKKMDYLIGGFDELNVLNKDTGSGSGSGSGISGNILGDIELPEYDMFNGLVESRVQDLVEKFRDLGRSIVDFVEPALPAIKGLGAAMLTAFAVDKLSDFISLIGKTKGIKAIQAAMAKLLNTYTETGSITKALGAGLKSFRSGLSMTTKVIAGAGGFTAALVTSYSAVKDWQLGLISGEAALGNIAVVAGAVGTALYVMLGPVGLAITALGVLAGSIAGAWAAERQLAAEAFQAEFYSAAGTSITSIADAYVKVFNATTQARQPIIDAQQVIEDGLTSIQAAGNELDTLAGKIQNGALTAQEAIPQITEQFDILYTETADVLTQVEQNIQNALVGSIGDTLETLGYQVPEISALIAELAGDAKASLEEYQTQLAELTAAWEAGDVSDTAFAEGFQQISRDMTSITQSTLPELTSFNSYISDEFLQNINFESPEAFTNAVQNIGTAATEAKDAIKQANDAIISDLELLRNTTSDPEKIGMIDGIISAIRTDTVNQQTEIDNAMKGVAERIQKAFSDQINAQIEAGPLLDQDKVLISMQSTLDDTLGTAASVVGERVLSSFTELDEPFAAAFGQYGIDSLTGYAQGIIDNQKIASDATKKWAEEQDRQFRATLGIKSPSKVFRDNAKYTMEGYRLGIIESIPNAVSAMKQAGDAFVDEMENIMSRLKSVASSGVTIRIRTSYSGGGGSTEDIPAFASGGVLTRPRVILAGEYASARSNPEIVSPQSLMRSTVEDANANMTAAIVNAINALSVSMNETSSAGGDITIKVELDGDEIYSNQQKVARRRGYPVSSNPSFSR